MGEAAEQAVDVGLVVSGAGENAAGTGKRQERRKGEVSEVGLQADQTKVRGLHNHGRTVRL